MAPERERRLITPHELERLVEGEHRVQDSQEQRQHFQRELDEVNDVLIRAALQVVETLPQLTGAFLAADRSWIPYAQRIGLEVEQACREVEHRGFVLIAREAPVGIDLRRIVALLRLVTDVDRAASLMCHVPEALDLVDPRQIPEDLRAIIERMASRAAQIYERGVDAWRTADGLAVNELTDMDGEVDRLQELLLEQTGNDDRMPPAAHVALGLVARYYERIADHGVAFACDAAFVATGARSHPEFR